jgi:hypothetical protein
MHKNFHEIRDRIHTFIKMVSDGEVFGKSVSFSGFSGNSPSPKKWFFAM